MYKRFLLVWSLDNTISQCQGISPLDGIRRFAHIIPVSFPSYVSEYNCTVIGLAMFTPFVVIYFLSTRNSKPTGNHFYTFNPDLWAEIYRKRFLVLYIYSFLIGCRKSRDFTGTSNWLMTTILKICVKNLRNLVLYNFVYDGIEQTCFALVVLYSYSYFWFLGGMGVEKCTQNQSKFACLKKSCKMTKCRIYILSV